MNAMRVRIDRSPERTSTWTGRPLALGATAWAVLMASVPSFSIASVALLEGHTERFAWVWLVGVALFTPAFLLVYAAAAYGDLRRKKPVCERYRCSARFGIDAVQVRTVIIEGDQPDVRGIALRALERIDPGVHLLAEEEHWLQAVRPGSRPRTAKSVIEVEWSSDRAGTTSVNVTSFPWLIRNAVLNRARPPRFPIVFDGGRSIENVEELQLALRREIEPQTVAEGLG